MKTRWLIVAGVLSSILCITAHGLAGSGKTLDASVEAVEMKEGKVQATVLSGANQNVLPGDKGFFIKDGEKVQGSEFEIDRVDDRLAWTKTGFKAIDDVRSQTSMKTRIVATRTCTRGGGRRFELSPREVAQGQQPAEGFVFAKVTSAERVHKTRIRVTIDKGTDDGVLPSSSAYALPSSGKPLAQYVSVDSVAAKTAVIIVDAGDADMLLKNVKRIAFERLTCKAAQ
jgi:hypothetical protein